MTKAQKIELILKALEELQLELAHRTIFKLKGVK